MFARRVGAGLLRVGGWSLDTLYMRQVLAPILSLLLLLLLPAFTPPLYFGMIVRVGAATLAVEVIDEHLLLLILGLDHLNLWILLLQALSRWFPKRRWRRMMCLRRAGLMWGAGVAGA